MWGYYTGEVNIAGEPHGEGVFVRCEVGGIDVYSGGFRDSKLDGLVTYRDVAGNVEVREMEKGVIQGNATWYGECGNIRNR